MRPNVSVEDSPRRSGAEVAVALPDDVAPAELIAALVTALPEVAGEQHLVYEQDGQWTLAFGINALIELDTDELRIVREGGGELRTGHELSVKGYDSLTQWRGDYFNFKGTRIHRCDISRL